MLAPDLLLQSGGQRTPVTGAYLVKRGQEARHQRHGVPDALAVQQPLDAVDMPRALFDQMFTLARASLAILIFHARHPHHAAGTRFAAQMRQEGAHQKVQIDLIGLGAPCPAVHLDAGCIDHVIDDTLVGQPAVQPVPVQSGLVA